MNKTIRSGARDIIYKVFKRCLTEYQAGKLLTDLEDVYKRTADLTGKSESKSSSEESESEDENDDMSGTSNCVLLQDSDEESMSGFEYLDFESLD